MQSVAPCNDDVGRRDVINSGAACRRRIVLHSTAIPRSSAANGVHLVLVLVLLLDQRRTELRLVRNASVPIASGRLPAAAATGSVAVRRDRRRSDYDITIGRR